MNVDLILQYILNPLILQNILNPPILFFFLGVLAVLWKSDLDLPPPIPRMLSLYLLLAIGFKGGVALAEGGLTVEAVKALSAAVLLAFIVPLWVYPLVRRKLDVYNAAAVAATYGSISAVTFITAVNFVNSLPTPVPYGGYMVAAMALMESPAIIIAVMLVRMNVRDDAAPKVSWKAIAHDAFLNGSVFLLLGSLVIGAVAPEKGREALAPLVNGLFQGLLTFFLLDMGIVAARRFSDLRQAGATLVVFALMFPVVNAAIGLATAYIFGLSEGDAFMLVVLAASASYIAVPAALRLSVPQANPSIYVSMSLAITFPFNIIVGLPMYLSAVRAIWE